MATLTYGRGSAARGSGESGLSPIFITAAVAALALVATLGWEATKSVAAKNIPLAASAGADTVFTPSVDDGTVPDTTSPQDPLSQIGTAVMNEISNAYFQMQDQGTYSSSTVAGFGQSLAPYVAATAEYQAFSGNDIKTDADTSYERMMRYRADLRDSLAPLLQNTVPEYEIFAQYVDTKDVTYLSKLQEVAQSYRATASSTLQVVVPADAAALHLGILNAMKAFAATLEAMVAHANDPFASVALLSGYNQAESDMLTSFNALTTYYKSKKL